MATGERVVPIRLREPQSWQEYGLQWCAKMQAEIGMRDELGEAEFLRRTGVLMDEFKEFFGFEDD